MAHPEECQHPSSANGDYGSAFPNVGLVVWQSGFVLAEYLLRTQPFGSFEGIHILELGCGTGQLGIALAMAGAEVTLTDLAHITPLTEQNVALNAHAMPINARVVDYMWGSAPEERHLQQPDVIVAADVLYEPQHYDELLSSLKALCGMQQSSKTALQAATVSGVSSDITHHKMAALTLQKDESPDSQGDSHARSSCTTCPCETCHSSNDAVPAAEAGSSTAATSCNQNLLIQGGSDPLQHTRGCVTQTARDCSKQAPCRCYICYRVRKYGEHVFESKAQQCGFDVKAVPIEQLHPDYRCGGYRLIELTPSTKDRQDVYLS